MNELDKIKKCTLRALMDDEILIHALVLKGGNALQLAYDITNRGSIDIDFSMENEFSEKEFKQLSSIFHNNLSEHFNKINYHVHDVKFIEKPKSGDIPEWKGYFLEFKLIDSDFIKKLNGDIDAIRRNSVRINDHTNSTKFTVDISAYEHVKDATDREVDGIILKVYTPEMLLIEKLRAMCQSMIEYKDIVSSARQKARARDLYDIYSISCSFTELNINRELVCNIFDAKRVPISFLDNFESLREQYRDNWETVKQTILDDPDLQEYDFYFDFVLKLISDCMSN